MIDPRLKDKVVLIMGANNRYGIGAATARAFAAQEARVHLHFFRSPSTNSDQEKIEGPGFIFSTPSRAKQRMKSFGQSTRTVGKRQLSNWDRMG